MAHLVVVPVPLYGHIFPMIHLSVQLAALGNKVSFITTSRTRCKALSSFESALFHYGCQASEIRKNLSFQVLTGDDSNEELQQGGHAGIIANISWMATEGRIDQLDQLVECCVNKQGPVSCILLDFLNLQFKQVAVRRGVSTAVLWTASPAYFLVLEDVNRLAEQGHIPLEDSSKAENIISDIPGVEELCIYKDLPFCLQKIFIGLEFVTKLAKELLEAPLLLFNTVAELDKKALDSIRELKPDMVVVGPLVPTPTIRNGNTNIGPPPPPDDQVQVFNWLDAKPVASVLYVSFGTLAEISAEQIQQLAQALQESQHSFIWVLRFGQAHHLAGFLEDFKQASINQGLVVPWCSQPQILRHPSIGGFMTHCGWNSILESLSCGVPMIGWPCIAEQNLNAKYLADVWKVATRIIPTNPNGSARLVHKSEIAKAIQPVMGDPEIKQRAQEARMASERAAESDLRDFLEKLTATKNRGVLM